MIGLPFVEMRNQRNPKRLKATVTGAFVCSLLGPTFGALAILGSDITHAHSSGAAMSAFGTLPWVWPIAVMLVGPGAFVLGGVGALVIQFASTRVRSAKALVLQTAILGLVLGGAVPVVTDLLYTALWGDRSKNFEMGLLPLSAVTGVVCAAATYWLLQRMGLLYFSQISDSEVA